MPTPDPWDTLQHLFDAGIAMPREERVAWLARLDVDDELRAELAEMLAADDRPDAVVVSAFDRAIETAVQVPQAGQALGAFRLIEEIGSGGGGTVFLAERIDGTFRQEVAIKVIRGVARPSTIRQLVHERQILASLDHPDIARVLDGGTTPSGLPWMAMELVRGQTITAFCTANRLPLERRLALMSQVARAVHHAHQHLVVHRDIKPSNVLVREDGRPVLLDFGIAKLLDGAPRESPATEPWFTPEYAAPEQRSGGTVSTATDVYSLGLLTFELLTGERPTSRGTDLLLMPSRAAPPALAPAMRGDLDRIVMMATDLDPADRYSSAEALAADIDRYLAGLPVSASPDRFGYRARKFVRRHRFGVAASVVAVALLAATVARLVVEHDRANRSAIAADAVSDFLIRLFEDAAPGATSKPMTPLELVERGDARVQADTRLDATQRARLNYTLGQLYSRLGEPVKSTERLGAAVAAARAGEDRLILAKSLVELAGAESQRAQRDRAEIAAREAVALTQSSGDAETRARALIALGQSVYRSHPDESEAAFRDAAEAASRAGGRDSLIAADANANLAYMLAQRGQADESRALFDAAIATTARQVDPLDPRLLDMKHTYAIALLGMRDFRRVEQIALDIQGKQERLQPSQSMVIASIQRALGNAYYEMDRLPEAEKNFALALEKARRKLSPDDPVFCTYLNTFGLVRAERGDTAQGIEYLRAALACAAPGSDSARQYTVTLANLLADAGEGDESWRLLTSFESEGVQELHRLRGLASWHVRYGDLAEADALLAACERFFDEPGDREATPYASLLRIHGEASRKRGDAAKARAAFERAHAIALAGYGDHSPIAAALALDVAELAQAAGDRGEARQWLTKASIPLRAALVPGAADLVRLDALAASLD